MPKKTIELRGGVSRGLEKGSSGVDLEKNIIFGYSVISKGEAMGHDLEIDDTTLDQVVSHGNSHKSGLKSRFGHPNMSNTAFGTFLGRSKNFRKDGNRVRADLHLNKTSFDTPKGNLGKYVLDLATEDPGAFGASIAFEVKKEVRLNEDGTRKKDKDGNVLLPLARVETLYASDMVDEPATEDSMFGFFNDSVKPSAEMTKWLNEFLFQDNALEKVQSFLDKYVENEQYKKSILTKMKKVVNMPEELKKDAVKNKITFTLASEPETKVSLSKEGIMPEELKKDAVTIAREKEIAELAAKTERDRITTITKLGVKMGIPKEKISECLANANTLDETAKIFTELEGTTVVDTSKSAVVKITKEAHDNMMEGMENSFLTRSGIIEDPKIRSDVAHSQYNGLSMKGCVRHFLSLAGEQDVHMLSGNELYTRIINRSQREQFDGSMAQATGDFTNLLSNVLNKSMAKGWDIADTTYQLWCGSGVLTDFKTADLVKMTGYGDVELIPEGEAPRESKFADMKEQAKLATWGSYFTLTRQALINDDMTWFTKVPARMTASYRRKINYRVYYLLFNNNGAAANFVGPTMLEDTVTLFNAATHANYLALGTGAAPAEATLNTAWNAMVNQNQPSPDGGRSKTIPASVKPKHIIHGPMNTMAVHKLLSSLYYSTSSGDPGDNYQISNIFGPGQPRNIQAVEEVLIDRFITATATYPWYLAADANLNDTITVFSLNGMDRPATSNAPSSIGEAEGMKYQVRGDFVVAAVDWRGLYCNTGR